MTLKKRTIRTATYDGGERTANRDVRLTRGVGEHDAKPKRDLCAVTKVGRRGEGKGRYGNGEMSRNATNERPNGPSKQRDKTG